MPTPGQAFKEVWQVKVWPKGLGQAKNLVGIYRLCLTDKTVNFVKLNSDAAGVVLQLMNVRRCGHSENFFFVEVWLCVYMRCVYMRCVCVYEVCV